MAAGMSAEHISHEHTKAMAPLGAAKLERVLRGSSPDRLLDSYETDGNTGDINGTAVTATTLANGVPAGTLGVNETRTITMSLSVTGPEGPALATNLSGPWVSASTGVTDAAVPVANISSI